MSLMFDEVHNLILSDDICKREYGELIPASLVDEARGRTNTRISKSSMNLNRISQSTTNDVVCGNCGKSGHLGRDRLQLSELCSKNWRRS